MCVSPKNKHYMSNTITDLNVIKTNKHSVLLQWTLKEENAMSYDIRYSKKKIDAENFDDSVKADVTVIPKSSGTIQSMYVNELEMDAEYFFAIKTLGNRDRVSEISNVISAKTLIPGLPDKIKVYSLDELQNEINSAGINGKIITLEAGTYKQNKAIFISNKNNITIQGGTDNYNDTVIKGPGNTADHCTINIILNNSPYITLKNFTISDSLYHAVQVTFGSHYFHADNIKTWNNGESGFKITGASQNEYDNPYSDYGVIERCMIGNDIGGTIDCVEGVDGIAARGWIIKNNIFKNIKKLNTTDVAYGLFFKANSIDTIMENNYFIDCDIALSFGGGGSGPPAIFRYGNYQYEHRGGIMRNNIVWGGKDTGIFVKSALDYKICNNTVWNSEKYPWASICFRSPNYPESCEPKGGEIYNNILRFPIESRTDADLRNNIAGDRNGLNPDIFVDVESGDFHLKSSEGTIKGIGAL